MGKTLNLLPLLFICFSSCFIKKNSDRFNFYKDDLPGMVKIDSNLYVDYSEIDNFFWLEYIYWNERVFGANSKEYLESIPDSTVWFNESCLLIFSEYYLRHPSYRKYPVVGISQKQIEQFCKWRSDRIFELLLIREKVITANPSQTADDYFSIDNYFNGKYNNIQPNLSIKTYPVFRLPKYEEWIKTKLLFEDLNKKNLNSCNKRYCHYKFKKEDLTTVFNITPCLNDSMIKEPTEPTSCYNNKKVGFHITGNVSEWLLDSNKIIGGNWKDTVDTYFDIPLVANFPKEYIGFRCISEWKERK
ncbi:MAG: SUMF1/EgtB/PvdO family nonheme iron enzyme [Flavobacteriales bacterium]